jgi:hypothetical protein
MMWRAKPPLRRASGRAPNLRSIGAGKVKAAVRRIPRHCLRMPHPAEKRKLLFLKKRNQGL